MLGTLTWPPSQYRAGPRGHLCGAWERAAPVQHHPSSHLQRDTWGVSEGNWGTEGPDAASQGHAQAPLSLTLDDRSAMDTELHRVQETRGAGHVSSVCRCDASRTHHRPTLTPLTRVWEPPPTVTVLGGAPTMGAVSP